MRISDWSSDVCSSDLPCCPCHPMHRSSTRSRTSGSTCGPTIWRSASTIPTTPSSMPAARPGAASLPSQTASHPSRNANGQSYHDLWRLVLDEQLCLALLFAGRVLDQKTAEALSLPNRLPERGLVAYRLIVDTHKGPRHSSVWRDVLFPTHP